MQKKTEKQMTNTQKAGDAVRMVADEIKEARKKLSKLSPKKHFENAGRVSGAVLLWLMEYTMRIANGVALDNFVLRATERRFKNKNEDGFVKRNPAFASHMLYYMIPVLMWMGNEIVDFTTEKIEDYKQKKEEARKREEERKAKEGTYAAFLERVEPVIPLLVSDIVMKEGVCVNEQGLHIVYDDKTGKPVKPGQKLKGKATIGFGSTVLADGTPVTSYTKPITTEEAYELAYSHIADKETLFVLYCYDVAFGNVDINTLSELIAMTSVAYNTYCTVIENEGYNCDNRFEVLRKLRDQYGYSITDEQVLDVFKRYPVTDPTSFGSLWLYGADKAEAADKFGEFLAGGHGIRWRRWLEAMILADEITMEELLQVPVGGMPEFFKLVGDRRDNWFTGKAGDRKLNKETVKEFKKWLKNPVDKSGKSSIAHWPKVTDFVPESEIMKALAYKDNLKLGNDNFDYLYDENTVDFRDVLAFDALYDEAIEKFRSGDFENAAKRYEDIAEKYPDEALVCNDLAITYINLMRYDDAIKYAEKVFEIGDKSQYSAANYNLGLVYQKKGKMRKALKYYENAVALGNKKAQQAINMINGTGNAKKKIAFNSGIQQMHQKNAKQDIFLYGKETTFNA